MPLRNRENVTTVLWDLDGTLVGIRQRCVNIAMPAITAYAFRDLMPPWRLLRQLGHVLPQVRANSTTHTNHDLLVRLLAEQTDIEIAAADARMRRLAEVDFVKLRRCFYPIAQAQAAVAQLAGQGIRQVVATNPMWPESSVTARLGWGGFDPATFDHITSGETMCRSKPSVEFFSELLEVIGARSEECVMIGNDIEKDSPAGELGIPVFVLGATGGWPDVPAWLGLEEAACSS